MSLSRPVLNLDALVAIDVHTHAETDGRGHYSLPDDMRAAADKYFGAQSGPPDVHQLAAYYRQRNMAAVVFTVDAESTLGHGRLRNEEIAEAAAQHPDVLIPFASIDPARGKAGVLEARRLVTDYGVRGFKFHPNLQAFWPNDRLAYPLYAAISELGVPALFHSGQTGIGSGLPGELPAATPDSNLPARQRPISRLSGRRAQRPGRA